MRDSKRIVAAAALWILASASSAWAEGEANSETGDTLFQQGRTAFAEGKIDLARSYFQRSLTLDPTPGTLLNLAVCEERLGQLVSAVDHLNEALERTPPDDKRRLLILARVAELERITPRVIVRTETPLAPRVVVTLDARPLDRATLGRAVRLDPGRHELNCTGPQGEQCPRSFALVQGDESEQVLQVVTPVMSAPAPPAGESSPPAVPLARNRTLAYALGALGVAGIGTSLVTGALVIDRKNTVAAHCRTDKVCDPEGLSAGESGATLSLVSTVAAGVGLVALGTSAYLLLSVPSSAKSTTMISVTGTF